MHFSLCAQHEKAYIKALPPAFRLCICFSFVENLFYCTFSDVTLWPPGFAIVNIYEWRHGLFQVRHAKLEWLGLRP